MNRTIKRILRLSGFGLIAILSSQTYAAGYKLEFQSASVLADAGEAAVVEDAGTNWYNSAGIVYLPQQLAVSSIDLYSRTRFSGSVFAPSLSGAHFSGSGSASSNSNVMLPGIHYVY